VTEKEGEIDEKGRGSGKGGILSSCDFYGAGARRVVTACAATHCPKAALQANIAGGVPTPAITVPKTNPAAA